MHAEVDKDTCIGCGLCPTLCEEVFEMDDDGKAVAKEEPSSDDIIAKAKDAEVSCPVNAITVE